MANEDAMYPSDANNEKASIVWPKVAKGIGVSTMISIHLIKERDGRSCASRVTSVWPVMLLCLCISVETENMDLMRSKTV